MPRRRVFCRGGMLLMIALIACSPSLRSRTGDPAQQPTEGSQSYGSEGLLEVPDRSVGEAPAEGPGDFNNGLLVVTLVDQNQLNPEGIPVHFSGPMEGIVYTDVVGQARVEGPPGIYTFEVLAGCTDQVLVHWGNGGRAGLVAGTSSSGTLDVIWASRNAPAYASYPSRYPEWRIGEVVDILYDVVDRCTEEKAAGAAYPNWRFRTGPHLEIVGTPMMKSGPNNKGLVRIRCSSEGRPTLVAFDSKNPSDEFDLIALAIAQGTIHCVQSY